MRFSLKSVLLFLSILLIHTTISAQEESTSETPQDRSGLDFFEAKIRPMLVKHCYACHSAEAVAKNKLKGALLLDTRAATLK